MPPTAHAISINVASGGTKKSMSTTAAASSAAENENDVQRNSPVTPAEASSPLPNEDTKCASPHTSPPSTSSNSDQFKDQVVFPGRLGLKVEVDAQGGGAVILQIDPTCTFRNQVQVGDRIVSIDGRVVKCVDDLLVGREKVRIFRIVPKGNSDAVDGAGSASLDGGEDSATDGGEPVQKQETDKETTSPVEAGGKRKRETDGDDTSIEQSAKLASKKTKTQHVEDTTTTTSKNPNNKEDEHQKINNQIQDLSQLALVQNQQQQIHMAIIAAQEQQIRQQEQQFKALQTKLHLAAQLALERQQKQEQEQNDQQCREEFKKWQEDWNTYQLRLKQYYANTNRLGDGWNIRFQQLQQYKRTHTDGIGGGNVNKIPLDYRDPSDLTLGEWARLQREMYWEGKLDQERVDYLLNEGFDFEYEPPSNIYTGDEKWDDKLKEFIEFKRKFFHTDVPVEYPTGQTLGHWVKEQRDLYGAGTLDEDRHVLLEEMGFIFEPGTKVRRTIIGETWMTNYKELVQFKRDHGHLEVATGYKATSLSADLNIWIDTQRRRFRDKELSKIKLRLLEEIGLDLTLRKRVERSKKLWESNFNKLLDYREEHGHVNVPKRFGHLGSWVRLQRQNFKRGQLLEDRKRRLLEIGFDFDPLKKTGDNIDDTFPTTTAPNPTVVESPVWFDTYEALKSFVETNGHADVPLGYKSNGINCCLHTWIETQKSFFEEDKLPEHQIQMLEELGINLSEKSENSNITALKDFHEENGHTDEIDSVSVAAQPKTFTIDLFEEPGNNANPVRVNLLEFCPVEPCPSLQFGNAKLDKRYYFSVDHQSFSDIARMMNEEYCLGNGYKVVVSRGSKSTACQIRCRDCIVAKKLQAATNIDTDKMNVFKILVSWCKEHKQYFIRQNAGHCLSHCGHCSSVRNGP